MAHLIPIGNSLGMRIPKAILIQLGFTKDTELMLTVTSHGLLISPNPKFRSGWAESFKGSKANHLLMGDEIVNQFDRDEWEW